MKKDPIVDNQIKSLSKTVRYAVYAGVFSFVISISIFVFNFYQQSLSTSIDKWGSFGSYLGGLMGLILGFLALLLVSRTFALQIKEMNEARIANEEQAQYLHAQVEEMQNQSKKKNDQSHCCLSACHDQNLYSSAG